MSIVLVLGIIFCILIIYLEKKEQQILKNKILRSILPLFCFYLIFDITVKTMSKGLNYYMLRNSIPFIVFCLAYFIKFNVSFKRVYQSGAIIAIIGFLFLNSNYNAQLTKQIMGLSWAYWVFIEYLVFSILFFEILAKKIRNNFQAFSYMLLLLPAIGFMYKLPIFTLPTFSNWYPFYFPSSPIMLLFVCYKIGFSTFIKPIVFISLFISILFGVYYYYFNPTLSSWIVRLPTLVFWLIAILHMKNNKKEWK